MSLPRKTGPFLFFFTQVNHTGINIDKVWEALHLRLLRLPHWKLAHLTAYLTYQSNRRWPDLERRIAEDLDCLRSYRLRCSLERERPVMKGALEWADRVWAERFGPFAPPNRYEAKR